MSMSTLGTDLSFDFTFPPCEPATPPSFSFDPSLLEFPYNPNPRHARSGSHSSVYSYESSPPGSVTSDVASTRMTTPSRSPIRTHGPLLLPKIRSQDQTIAPSTVVTAAPTLKRMRTSPPPGGVRPKHRPAHMRSYTNPETINFNPSMFQPLPSNMNVSVPEETASSQLLCSPVSFASTTSQDSNAVAIGSRRASSCDLVGGGSVDKFAFSSYGQLSQVYGQTPVTANVAPVSASTSSTPTLATARPVFSQTGAFAYPQQYAPRASSPLASAASMTPEPVHSVAPVAPVPVAVGAPSTTLLSYLTTANPAPALVRNISFPLRDPQTKHFWWDVRQIRPWTAFSASSIMTLPGAAALLSLPVPASLLPQPAVAQRHPETEVALHSIYASFYLPKLNSALALTSTRPLQLSLPSKNPASSSDCAFIVNVAGESSSVATIFGGKPTGRVVGLVKSFDRFNTGMRVESNIKRVEYLRGLSHLHHVMREHGCRYGFIMTEIELVFVRNGAEGTPHFGYLEVGSTQLAAQGSGDGTAASMPLTACLALWGLCMLAGDEALPGHAHWRSEIGAPAEGTRRKALPRDDWMPQPQLAEKREAKRARGWIFPEDAVGRKELGKRGVRYGAC